MADSILDISKVLENYVDDIKEDIIASAEKIASDGVSKLKNTKNTYKIRSGNYNKGWAKKIEKGPNYVNITIHNGSSPQLTYWLENGHATRNGGMTKAYVHISPVEEECVNEFELEVENIVRRNTNDR